MKKQQTSGKKMAPKARKMAKGKKAKTVKRKKTNAKRKAKVAKRPRLREIFPEAPMSSDSEFEAPEQPLEDARETESLGIDSWEKKAS